MVNIDMSSMSDETRERFLELREREAIGQIDPFGAEELYQIRRAYGVTKSQ